MYIIKIINIIIIKIEILEYQQYLKIYKISLKKYLNKRKIELL